MRGAADQGQRVLTLPADLGPLDRGAGAGPGLVQTLEVEQAFGELVFEGDEGFGGGEHGRIIGQGTWPIKLV